MIKNYDTWKCRPKYDGGSFTITANRFGDNRNIMLVQSKAKRLPDKL